MLFCGNCSAQVAEEEKFCASCGSSVNESAPKPTMRQTETGQQQQQPISDQPRGFGNIRKTVADT